MLDNLSFCCRRLSLVVYQLVLREPPIRLAGVDLGALKRTTEPLTPNSTQLRRPHGYSAYMLLANFKSVGRGFETHPAHCPGVREVIWAPGLSWIGGVGAKRDLWDPKWDPKNWGCPVRTERMGGELRYLDAGAGRSPCTNVLSGVECTTLLYNYASPLYNSASPLYNLVGCFDHLIMGGERRFGPNGTGTPDE